MFCPKCGKEIDDNSIYCRYCGCKINEGVVYTTVKKTTFKEAIGQLFSKLFVFDGRSSRSEFNYGFLFLIIVATIFSMFTVSPEMMDMLMANPNMDTTDLLLSVTSKDILNPYNLYMIGASLMYAIFLSAPIFRRLTDTNMKKPLVIVMTVIFVVSQITTSGILYCLLTDDVYNSIYPLLDILGLANTFIIFYCMFAKTKNSTIVTRE